MEFEDMQAIWTSQNEEQLYAVDERALYAQIRRRSQSLDRKLSLFDWIMIGINLGVGIVLLIDGLLDNDQVLQFAMPAAYLAFVVVAFVRRLVRRKDEERFADTMKGELDKAIWRVDYLIAQGRSITLWYLVPLLLLFTVFAVLNDELLWAIVLLAVLVPAAYLGGRWEVNRFYLPKKRALESLRDQLVAPE